MSDVWILISVIFLFMHSVKSLGLNTLKSVHGSRLLARQETSTLSSDIVSSFGFVDRFLFSRFAVSVGSEIGKPAAQSYTNLIEQINTLNREYPIETVHEKGKRMLVRLFPSWLLPQYKWMFSAPFPAFSAWMNAV
jgi:hypothetical protein